MRRRTAFFARPPPPERRNNCSRRPRSVPSAPGRPPPPPPRCCYCFVFFYLFVSPFARLITRTFLYMCFVAACPSHRKTVRPLRLRDGFWSAATGVVRRPLCALSSSRVLRARQRCGFLSFGWRAFNFCFFLLVLFLGWFQSRSCGAHAPRWKRKKGTADGGPVARAGIACSPPFSCSCCRPSHVPNVVSLHRTKDASRLPVISVLCFVLQNLTRPLGLLRSRRRPKTWSAKGRPR